MNQRTTQVLALVALMVPVISSCAGKCPAANSAKSAEALEYDDIKRVNRFVERRKHAMKIAEKGSELDVEKARFTVQACELGIKLQLRIINIAREETSIYEEHKDRINQSRCLMSKILEKKGKVLGFVGPGGAISKKDASLLQDENSWYEGTLGPTGAARNSQLAEVYENGLPEPKSKKKGKGKKKSTVDEGGDEDVVGGPSGEEGGEGEGEGGGEGEEGGGEGEEEGEESSSMDAF